MPTEPLSRPTESGQRANSFSDDTGWGALNSPDVGSYDGEIDSWNGSFPRKPTPTGHFHFPTIISVNVSGEVHQVPGIRFADGHWGPLGTADHQAAVGWIRVFPTGGSQAEWPSKVSDNIVSIQGDLYGLGSGLNSPQPMDLYAWDCGYYAQVPCWTFAGSAHLDFTRIPVELTLSSSSADSTAKQDTTVVFTAGMSQTSIGGNAVDMSAVRWRWVADPETPPLILASKSCAPLSPGCTTATRSVSADTSTAGACVTAAGTTCSHIMKTSGTMYVTAYVNGKQQQQSMHVAKSIETTGGTEPDSCHTGNPEIDNPKMDSVFKELWRKTRYSPTKPQAFRLEQGGYITRKNGVYGFVPVPGIDACSIDVEYTHGPFLNGVPVDSVVAWVHTHPAADGEPMSYCAEPLTNPDGTPILDANGETQWPLYKRLPSDPNDRFAEKLFGQHGIVGYILDASGITKYGPGGPADDKFYGRCGY